MCGIAGATSADEPLIRRMLGRIAHRGPDAVGIDGIHGHVRLSLVDLSAASNQPFRRGNEIISFNGEIWNYKQLRAQLQQDGCGFATSGDTEVLAAMLEVHGMNCLPMLDGMFAFCWSNQTESWLVRDSFGKVPLYVAKIRGGYVWASERKSFEQGVQPMAVPPGHAFNLKSGQWRRWYQMPRPHAASAAFVLDRLRQGTLDRLQADAPVCCLISGGLDSSIILALARESSRDVTAYIAKFDESSEDLKSARRLCSDMGVRLNEVQVQCTPEAVQESLGSIEISSKAQIEIAALCLPLARRISTDGFKACLSGEAADELFGGYGNFCIAASRVTDSGVVKLRREQLAKMSRGNFIRCNKAFMSAGVECRLPFMDQQLVESAIQWTKRESPTGKKLLKQAAARVVPSWVIKRQKDTFQGGSGMAAAIGKMIASPAVWYNSELRKRFGYLPKD